MIASNIIDLMSRRLDWDLNTIMVSNVSEPNMDFFYYVSGVEISTQETITAVLFIDDGLTEKFDYESYKKIASGDNDIFIAVFVNYERENRLLNESVPKRSPDAFLKMWDEKVSIYLESSETIRLNVDQSGINFLENSDEFIEGYVYNVSMAEIMKIIQCTGINLFRDNVRVGLKRGAWAKRLRVNFKDYILSAILENNEFIAEDNLEEAIRKALFMRRKPSLFWFSHNGISIYSKLKDKDDSYRIIRKSATIELDPFRISVINGAQTITNFFKASEEVKSIILRANKTIGKDDAETIVRDALEKIKVKTTIINGPADYISDITLGLNTQIPVGEDEQVITDKTLTRCNKILSNVNIKIVRPGEYMDDFCLTPQKFVKWYYVAKNEPGRARNLNVKKLREDFEHIDKALNNTGMEELLEKMRQSILSSIWWRNSSDERSEASKDIESIMANATYYFCSYVNKYIELAKYSEPITEELYMGMFTSLVQKISEINDTRKKGNEVSSNDFKSDDMYKDIISKLEKDF